MGVGTVWSRALVYFGIVEEDEYWDEEAYAAEEELERTYERDRQNVRRLNPRRREDGRPPPARRAPAARGRRLRLRASPPRRPSELQRRAVDRRQVQGVRARDRQPPGDGPRALEAPHRLLERSHVCPQREHAAGRRQGLPADAAQRRGLRRRARPPDRPRLLQPGLAGAGSPP